MIYQNLIYRNFFFKKKISKNLYKKNLNKFHHVEKQINLEINNKKKMLFILNQSYKFNFNFKDLKNFANFNIIALIGMGGSILGTKAIHNFFKKKIKKKVYFFDNLDFEKISKFKKKENNNKVLFLIISKSGNTIETLSNLLILEIIKKKSKNIIIISEKKDSFLKHLANKFNLYYVEHNEHVGGRYSVLSEVGILPSYLMGVDIFKLRTQIKDFLKGKHKLFLKESSINLANIMNNKKTCFNKFEFYF